ncbi:hypothetical protein [Aquella oligotrophica]|uniref:Uncharacterized protein n=1 Tax=Aquella oligotrophica TaxID=2067065 RepID=A0A2I7N5N3_9NEIS|nr:hypothetical protein [Aquella oligotrophica]AUR51783.1 hypothetical protein CUN60_05570 [Aquella oligotrophica]
MKKQANPSKKNIPVTISGYKKLMILAFASIASTTSWATTMHDNHVYFKTPLDIKISIEYNNSEVTAGQPKEDGLTVSLGREKYGDKFIYNNNFDIVFKSGRKASTQVAKSFKDKLNNTSSNWGYSAGLTGTEFSELNFYIETTLSINNFPIIGKDQEGNQVTKSFYLAQNHYSFYNTWWIGTTASIVNEKCNYGLLVETSENDNKAPSGKKTYYIGSVNGNSNEFQVMDFYGNKLDGKCPTNTDPLW